MGNAANAPAMGVDATGTLPPTSSGVDDIMGSMQDANVELMVQQAVAALREQQAQNLAVVTTSLGASVRDIGDLPPEIIPSIENNYYWYICIIYIAIAYLLIPIIMCCWCGCRADNKIDSSNWLADSADLDMDLSAEEPAQKIGDDGSAEAMQPLMQKAQTRERSKFSPFGLEIYLARNAKEVSFIILSSMIIVLLLCYGVFLETILYQDKETELLAIGVPIGRGFGVVTNFTMLLVLLLMARLPLTYLANTPLALILPLEVSFELHQVFAYITFFSGTIHGLLQTVNFATNPNRLQTWEGVNERVVFGGRSTFISGWILYAIFVLMLLTFFKPLKSCFGYQGFINMHKGWIPYLILLYFHGNEKGLPVYWKWGIVPTLVLCLHYAMQAFSKKKTKSIIVLDKCTLDKEAKVIRLEVLRGNFKFKAGQYAFISVEALGTEKHPLTIASAPAEETVTFFIKVAGDWTEKLYNLLESRKQNRGLGPLRCTMRGGFGAPTEFAYQFEDVVLVGTGVGATPFLSLMKDIIWSNSVNKYIKEEAMKLSPDRQAAKKAIEDSNNDMEQIQNEYRMAHPKKKRVIKKKKMFNTFTYGVMWQIVLSIFICFTYVDSVPFDENRQNSLGQPIILLPVEENIGNFRITYDFFWYFFGIYIILGYFVDIIYRLQVEAHDMHRRQMIELSIHTVFWLWLIVVWLYRISLQEVLEYRFALPLMILNGFSNIAWFLYINRIAGLRLSVEETSIKKQTKSLRFIYVDRKFEGANWIVTDLLNIQRLAKEKLGDVECIIDVYFTRDTVGPDHKEWAESEVINTFIGRPDWDVVVNELINHKTATSDVDLATASLQLADAKFIDVTKESKNILGMFFCGSPLVATALRKAAAKYSNARNFRIVWHKEAFG